MCGGGGRGGARRGRVVRKAVARWWWRGHGVRSRHAAGLKPAPRHDAAAMGSSGSSGSVGRGRRSAVAQRLASLHEAGGGGQRAAGSGARQAWCTGLRPCCRCGLTALGLLVPSASNASCSCPLAAADAGAAGRRAQLPRAQAAAHHIPQGAPGAGRTQRTRRPIAKGQRWAAAPCVDGRGSRADPPAAADGRSSAVRQQLSHRSILQDRGSGKRDAAAVGACIRALPRVPSRRASGRCCGRASNSRRPGPSQARR